MQRSTKVLVDTNLLMIASVASLISDRTLFPESARRDRLVAQVVGSDLRSIPRFPDRVYTFLRSQPGLLLYAGSIPELNGLINSRLTLEKGSLQLQRFWDSCFSLLDRATIVDFGLQRITKEIPIGEISRFGLVDCVLMRLCMENGAELATTDGRLGQIASGKHQIMTTDLFSLPL